MKYIFMDVESGGLEPTKNNLSLLTAYFAVTDENLNVLDTLDLYLKESDNPKKNVYHVTEGALEVNKIDLRTHSKRAITREKGAELLYNFLSQNSTMGGDKLIPVGCNVKFDIQFICERLVNEGTWEKFCSYITEDVGSHIRFFQRNNLLPKSMPGSLSKVSEYFGIDSTFAHSAKGDVDMTIAVMTKLEELLHGQNIRCCAV